MRVRYQPEDKADGDGGEWIFNPKRVRQSQAEQIEKRYGQPWDMFAAACQAGEVRARRVLLWHLMRLDHPSFRWEDTPDFYTGEVTCEYSAQELQALLDQVREASLPTDQRDLMVAQLEGELRKASTIDGEVVGKAPSKTAG